MNKTDAFLHRKSQASAVAAFSAAKPDQNGGKVEICTMAGTPAGFTRGQNAPAETVNVVRTSVRCRF